jgi:hypothetical protein
MGTADGYTLPHVVYSLNAVDMARTLRQDKQADAFLVTTCAISEAIEEITTDQSEKWTTELRSTVRRFEDIVKEPGGLPPKWEWDFEIVIVIVYNMSRQTGPSAVSRATLLRHT